MNTIKKLRLQIEKNSIQKLGGFSQGSWLMAAW
jgi:hypothetical protein